MDSFVLKWRGQELSGTIDSVSQRPVYASEGGPLLYVETAVVVASLPPDAVEREDVKG